MERYCPDSGRTGVAVREVTQSILHGDPSGVPGNCLQAAVASLLDLDLEQVPHFIRHDDWLDRLAGFCRAYGYQVRHRQPAPTTTGIGVGPSPRGVKHAVVVIDGQVVWDPHPSRDGLTTLSAVYALEPPTDD